MPCMDGGPSREDINAELGALRGLCSILTAKPKLVRYLDVDGLRWWADHQEDDRVRLEREEEERRRNLVLDAAAAKLTPEERRELGL